VLLCLLPIYLFLFQTFVFDCSAFPNRERNRAPTRLTLSFFCVRFSTLLLDFCDPCLFSPVLANPLARLNLQFLIRPSFDQAFCEFKADSSQLPLSRTWVVRWLCGSGPCPWRQARQIATNFASADSSLFFPRVLSAVGLFPSPCHSFPSLAVWSLFHSIFPGPGFAAVFLVLFSIRCFLSDCHRRARRPCRSAVAIVVLIIRETVSPKYCSSCLRNPLFPPLPPLPPEVCFLSTAPLAKTLSIRFSRRAGQECTLQKGNFPVRVGPVSSLYIF